MATCLSVRSCAAAATALVCVAFTSSGCAMEPMDGEPVDEDEAAELEGYPGSGVAYDFVPIEPCLSESDYISRGAVRFGLSYHPFTPPCVRLASGGTVVFQGSLTEHPIAPRSLGTAPSQIQLTAGGSRVEFEFPDYGTFPYRCARHPDEIGVVWSTSQ